MRWRLGLDHGTNSLGWAVVELDDDDAPCRLVAAGTRIFSDGRDSKSGESLAVARRAARSMRRRRDRFKQRQAALIKHLTLAGLFPATEPERAALVGLDPYALRAQALHEPLPLHHLGRALFHLNQRRGFKSNRKTDRGPKDDGGKIRVGVARLHEAMRDDGAATLGEYLHHRRASASDPNAVPNVRTRMNGADAAQDGYDFYPDRRMLEEEFEAICAAQAVHHPAVFLPETGRRLFEVVFPPRPLKRPAVGTCLLVPDEERLPKAHPLFQQRRMLEELNHLRVVRPGAPSEALTLAQRDLLHLRLRDRRSVSFETLRKTLGLDPDARFSAESANRKEIKGDEVTAELSAKARFGKAWGALDAEARWVVISRLRDMETEQDEADMLGWLQAAHRLTPEQADAVLGARLPEGHGRLGITATKRLVAALRAKVIVYSEAVREAGFAHHSDFRTGEVLAELPYYGAVLDRFIMPGTGNPNDADEALRVGRLTNPTIHVGLNQLRRVVNRLIARFGPPRQIAIELARELKLDDAQKDEVNRRERLNREAAQRRSKSLQENGLPDKGSNRARLKLWEELSPENVLDRRCVYTGRQISVAMLFSDAVEIDHILPFSATLDDSQNNRLLCLREANRDKRKRSPFEAFGHRPDWEDIAARAARLPSAKRWRFEPDAMTRFDTEGGFLARHLVDTQYLSRLDRDYLAALYPGSGEGSGRVWVSPGRLTEMLRRSWGLNSILPDHNFAGGADQPKNRRDHRHHAIDAVVVAVTDRGLLQRISREAGLRGHEAANRMTHDLPLPWDGFGDEIRTVVRAIQVSHRPDHGTAGKARLGTSGTAGRLHNDTAYGLTDEKNPKGDSLVVHRVPLGALKVPADIGKVRNSGVRNALLSWTSGVDGKAFEARLARFPLSGPAAFRGMRGVRVIEPLAVIPIRDREGRAYKGYKGDSNLRYDVWALKDGRWTAEVVSMFDAHQSGWTSRVRTGHPTAKKVLSLHQNDTVAVEPEVGSRKLMRVVKFGQNGQVTLAELHEAGALKTRDAAPDDPFKYSSPTAGGLKRLRARQVRIDELGRVWDPGPRDSSSTP